MPKPPVPPEIDVFLRELTPCGVPKRGPQPEAGRLQRVTSPTPSQCFGLSRPLKPLDKRHVLERRRQRPGVLLHVQPTRRPTRSDATGSAERRPRQAVVRAARVGVRGCRGLVEPRQRAGNRARIDRVWPRGIRPSTVVMTSGSGVRTRSAFVVGRLVPDAVGLLGFLSRLRRGCPGVVWKPTRGIRRRQRVRAAARSRVDRPEAGDPSVKGDCGYGGCARRPSAEAAEAPRFTLRLAKPGLGAAGELDRSSPTLKHEVRSSGCMPALGATRASIRAGSRS